MNHTNLNRTTFGLIGAALMTLSIFGALEAMLPKSAPEREARIAPHSIAQTSATMWHAGAQ